MCKIERNSAISNQVQRISTNFNDFLAKFQQICMNFSEVERNEGFCSKLQQTSMKINRFPQVSGNFMTISWQLEGTSTNFNEFDRKSTNFNEFDQFQACKQMLRPLAPLRESQLPPRSTRAFTESRHVDKSAGQSSHSEHAAKLTRRQHVVWTWQRVIF